MTGKVDAFAPHAEIIHIDIDPSSISKNIKVDVPIVGDCRRVLRALVEAVKQEKDLAQSHEARRPWHAQIAEWRKAQPLRYDWSDDVIKPQYVIQEISNLTRGEAMIVTGVGQHQMWAAQYYKFKHPRAWFTSGGLGTMGYGLPTAMGVQAAHPDKQVINIDGDGSFQMNSQELATCFTEHLPVKTVIINNAGHGMVRQWQRIIYKERYCAIDLPADPRLGEAGRGLRLRRPARQQADRGGAGHREDAEHAGPGHSRRDRRQGRVRVPHGAGRRRQHRHDPGSAQPRDAREGGEVADGVLT